MGRAKFSETRVESKRERLQQQSRGLEKILMQGDVVE